MTGLDPYTCAEAFRRLDDHLDRELSPEETELVRAHLETCAVCAAEFRFEARVLAEVRAKLARVAAPPDLLGKVKRAIERAGGDSRGAPGP